MKVYRARKIPGSLYIQYVVDSLSSPYNVAWVDSDIHLILLVEEV